jgi:hypothetical protein
MVSCAESLLHCVFDLFILYMIYAFEDLNFQLKYYLFIYGIRLIMFDK